MDEFQEINLLMNNFLDNRNTLAKIHTELTNTFDKEYYLAKLSNTLVEAFNTFEKFYATINDKLEFAKLLDDVSKSAVDFFTIKTKENLGKMSIFKKRRILKKSSGENQRKLNELFDKLDIINNFIVKNVNEITKSEE